MKAILQRVQRAHVTVEGRTCGSIDTGLVILLGIHHQDSRNTAAYLAQRCAHLRIFDDDQGRMHLSLAHIGGSALVISQFTLYGDCTRGRRPNFSAAAGRDTSEPLYRYFIECLGTHIPRVREGVFGAHMELSLVNDGPVTIVLTR